MRLPTAVASLAAVLLVAAMPARADLITNSGFEMPVVPVGGCTNYTAPSTAITGWTVVGVDLAVTSGSFMQNGITFNAHTCVQWLDLAGVTSNSKSSGVMQTIITVPGSTYLVSFYVGSASDGSAFFTSTVDLSIDARQSCRNATAPRKSMDRALCTQQFTASAGRPRSLSLMAASPTTS